MFFLSNFIMDFSFYYKYNGKLQEIWKEDMTDLYVTESLYFLHGNWSEGYVKD